MFGGDHIPWLCGSVNGSQVKTVLGFRKEAFKKLGGQLKRPV
jgi:hypothetical protein